MNSFIRLAVTIFAVVLAPNVSHAAIEADSIRPERELFITAPAVVDAPEAQFPNAWSFGRVMQELVGEELAPATTRAMLESWTRWQLINSHVVSARLGIVEKLIRPWQQRDGYAEGSEKPWEPNLANAPFRLLAIVNRMDLCAPEI